MLLLIFFTQTSFSQPNPILISGRVGGINCTQIEDVDIKITEGTGYFVNVTTDATGYYEEYMPPCSIYEIHPQKDDFDPEFCGISKFDIAQIVDHIIIGPSADLPDFSWYHFFAGDVNKDRYTNLVDAGLMLAMNNSYYCGWQQPTNFYHWTFTGADYYYYLKGQVGVPDISIPAEQQFPSSFYESISISNYVDNTCVDLPDNNFIAFKLGDLVGKVDPLVPFDPAHPSKHLGLQDCDCDYNAPNTPLSYGWDPNANPLCYTPDAWNAADCGTVSCSTLTSSNSSESRNGDSSESAREINHLVNYVILRNEKSYDIVFTSDQPDHINMMTLAINIPRGYTYENVKFSNEEDLNVKHYDSVNRQVRIAWVNMGPSKNQNNNNIFTLQLSRSMGASDINTIDFVSRYENFVGSDFKSYKPEFVSIVDNNNEFSVYPTLFDQSITIENSLLNYPCQFEMWNSKGELILVKTIGKEPISRIPLPKKIISGIYYYRIYNSKNIKQTGKLIKI